MLTLFSDLYDILLSDLSLINFESFRQNKNNCVNWLLAKLYDYDNINRFYIYMGYISQTEFVKLNYLILNGINDCKKILM